jgi:hypothetical protein
MAALTPPRHRYMRWRHYGHAELSFNFGRIGHPRDWATKIEDADEEEARAVLVGLSRAVHSL